MSVVLDRIRLVRQAVTAADNCHCHDEGLCGACHEKLRGALVLLELIAIDVTPGKP